MSGSGGNPDYGVQAGSGWVFSKVQVTGGEQDTPRHDHLLQGNSAGPSSNVTGPVSTANTSNPSGGVSVTDKNLQPYGVVSNWIRYATG